MKKSKCNPNINVVDFLDAVTFLVTHLWMKCRQESQPVYLTYLILPKPCEKKTSR
jgi:hypothetical protein